MTVWYPVTQNAQQNSTSKSTFPVMTVCYPVTQNAQQNSTSKSTFPVMTVCYPVTQNAQQNSTSKSTFRAVALWELHCSKHTDCFIRVRMRQRVKWGGYGGYRVETLLLKAKSYQRFPFKSRSEYNWIVTLGSLPWEIRVAFSPGKTSCDRVALPNPRCVLNGLVFPQSTELWLGQ